ncbi:agamous-like MADS-box protein AGL62 [Senna tora]|uniref:Agamous-like MADS-box protein AGL62 n=1 Tax=Senna tora TaxID=362788 RepID=A0A834SY69_9FABA|nr:agamous-like MADS-box protein AGL62 [Senna tora]
MYSVLCTSVFRENTCSSHLFSLTPKESSLYAFHVANRRRVLSIYFSLTSAMASPAGEKKTKGQQKIELRRMENEKSLSVTFSKRRKGLFSKASALATLCGAEVAIMVVSPGGRLYAFGSPNVQSVVDRYLSGGRAQPQDSLDVLGNLHAQLRRVVAQVEAEERRAEELRRTREELEAKCWMAAPYDTLSPTQLMQVKARLLEMSMELTRLLNRRVAIHNHNNNAFAAADYNLGHNQFCPGGASSSHNPVALPRARGIPLPPMPIMSPVLDQNQAFGGNMLTPPPPPPPYYNGWNNMGGYGGPPGGFY